ncbi:fumarylacetoacetate hydrolase family protein [Phaeobacter inhibens]|uniref:fumarylacetoacetate hydrolase family protein n=1 Tax=Phaeobacter inhibens TaxID=221822 RepID=UPI0021A4512C|nr:fumarylacetoacetate hydrolase family protein [Phaeobacter inhibens]
MMKRIALSACAICAGFLFWVFALNDDPSRLNPISIEAGTLSSDVLPIEQAITLGQVKGEDGRAVPLLITGLSETTVTAVDLTGHGASADLDLFKILEEVPEAELVALYSKAVGEAGRTVTQDYPLSQFLPAAGKGQRHIGSGTNFPEHAEETTSSSVFSFPKFGVATPPVTSVAYDPEVLLDYEVEICARFDRDIASLADFESARKGFFLCGDFTDRSTLLKMIDTDNFDSGSGFSDAKSGPGYLPSGPFLVIPVDWRSFVEQERIETRLDGALRQDARGGQMILDFGQLVEKVLDDSVSTRFLYQGDRYQLIEDAVISTGQVLMSGTPEGVIFMPPSLRHMARGVIRHVVTGAFVGQASGYDSVIASFIQDEFAAKRFLQPGQVVTYASASMGTISITVRR